MVRVLSSVDRRVARRLANDDQQVAPRQAFGAEPGEPQTEFDQVVLDGLPVFG